MGNIQGLSRDLICGKHLNLPKRGKIDVFKINGDDAHDSLLALQLNSFDIWHDNKDIQ